MRTMSHILWLNEHPQIANKKKLFWSKVKTSKRSECWPWLAGRFLTGYGAFKILGKNFGSHRVALLFHLHFMPMDRQVHVRHQCHNKLCCNPYHLKLGEAADNLNDSKIAGRLPTGDRHYSRKQPWRLCRGDAHRKAHHASIKRFDRHPKAKLTCKIVKRCRRLYATGKHTIKEFADHYGVSISVMHNALVGKTWKF